jgi:hypothetical protein
MTPKQGPWFGGLNPVAPAAPAKPRVAGFPRALRPGGALHEKLGLVDNLSPPVPVFSPYVRLCGGTRFLCFAAVLLRADAFYEHCQEEPLPAARKAPPPA